MSVVPIVAWCAAAAVAAVVLGSCAYELAWKAARLRSDLRGLAARAEELAALRARLAETRQRLTATGLR